MTSTRIVFSLILMLAIITAISCGDKLPPRPEGMPNPTPCTIVIQDDSGAPVDKALVVMRPESGSQWMASGATDASGSAVMKTDGMYPGAVPGKYKVTVSKSETTMTGQMSAEGTEIVQTKALIDPKFSKAETTPLSVEVGTGSVSETFKVSKP